MSVVNSHELSQHRLQRTEVYPLMTSLISEVLLARPKDPIAFMIDRLAKPRPHLVIFSSCESMDSEKFSSEFGDEGVEKIEIPNASPSDFVAKIRNAIENSRSKILVAESRGFSLEKLDALVAGGIPPALILLVSGPDSPCGYPHHLLKETYPKLVNFLRPEALTPGLISKFLRLSLPQNKRPPPRVHLSSPADFSHQTAQLLSKKLELVDLSSTPPSRLFARASVVDVAVKGAVTAAPAESLPSSVEAKPQGFLNDFGFDEGLSPQQAAAQILYQLTHLG